MNSFRRLSGSGLLRAFVERRSTPRYSKAAPVPAVQCVFERLEPRILLSADVLGGIAANDLLQGDQHAELTSFDANQNLEQLIAPFLVSTDKQLADSGSVPTAIDLADFAGLLNAAADDSASYSDVDAFADSLKSLLPELGSNDALRQEIIFVDAATPDYEQLIAGITAETEQTNYLVFILDGERDGVAQMGEVLANYTGVDAIHLVSHGSDGEVRLGNGVLNSNNLGEYAKSLQGWQQALDADADFLIYGCNLAASETGQDLLQSLASLTGADIAASDDLTGNVLLGGDWELEYNVGEIESQLAFSAQAQQQWQYTLDTTFTVNTFDDTIDINLGDGVALDAFGNTSLRAAIMEANALAGHDTINLGAGSYKLTLLGAPEDASESGDLDIRDGLTIIGAGAGQTFIDGDGKSRVMQIIGDTAFNVSISNLTIQKGDASTVAENSGAGLHIGSLPFAPVVSLDNVWFFDNRTGGGGDSGGAIFNGGDLTITNALIEKGSAEFGGGIMNDVGATLSLTNVTLSDNTATGGDGGGLFNAGTATLLNVTAANNQATGAGGGIHSDVPSGATTTINNTLIAYNSAGSNPDIDGAFVSSTGDNFVENAGTASGLHASDITGVDPLLGNLGANGGATKTHALTVGSAAIGNASPGIAPLDDQRGYTRDAAADIGAYEFNGVNADPTLNNAIPDQYTIFGTAFSFTFDVNTFGDTDAGEVLTYRASLFGGGALPAWLNFDASTRTFSGTASNTDHGQISIVVTADDGSGGLVASDTFVVVVDNPDFVVNSTDDTVDINLGDGLAIDAAGNTSLRAAIMESNALAGSDTIILGTATYLLDLPGIDASGGDLNVTTEISIEGAGAGLSIIDGGGIDRVFEISSAAANLALSGLTVQGGDAGAEFGGAILVSNPNAVLDMNRVDVTGNQAAAGGGIYNKGNTFLTDVTIAGNNALVGEGAGGGFYNWDSATFNNVTVSGNTATQGGGIYNEYIANLTNVTLSGNTATVSEGGGLYNTGGAAAGANLQNVTVSNNTAQTQGGGIFNGGSATISNTIVANNTSVGGTGHDVFGTFASDGSNLIEDVGTSAASFTGDAIGDPNLAALADNGGFTQTHALLSGSLAIDNGTSTEDFDQRGYARVGVADIGAYEAGSFGLVWVDQAAGKIQTADYAGNNVTDMLTGLTSPLSVAVDMQAGKVYWSDDVLNTIQRANFDGTGVETIISSVPGTISIDLDTVNGKIYWVEGSGGTLLRANLDGTGSESLIGSPSAPSGIAIDVANNKIYWADPGVDRIKQTSLDGIGTSNLISSGLGNSADIALDASAGHLYWSDDVSGTIKRVNVDGTNIVTLISGLSSPYGLAVDGSAGKIYWTDSATGQLHSANLDGSNNQAIATGLSGARDVDVVMGAATAVASPNTAPVADAGGPYTINEGDSLVLNASGSSDIDPDTLSYTWDIDGDGQYDDASGINPTISWASLGAMSVPINDDGPYTIMVRVDDGAGGVTTDSVSLTVNNVAPTLSTTGTGSATAGLDYTLNLSAIDPGADIISSWTINWGDGSIETFAGNPTSVTHTYANTGFTYNILASAVDEDGTHMQNELLVASGGNDSLLRFGPDAAFLQKFATADGSDYPVDIIVGPDGNLYVSGWLSDNVLRYNATTGAFIDTFIAAGTGGLDSAAGLAFGPDGNLYVASRLSGEVLRFDASNGNFLNAFVSTTGSGGLGQPEGLTFGPDGDLYVTDYQKGEVYKYDGTTGAFDSVFVKAADSGGLATPEDLTFGPDGNLYVASDDGSSVLRYNGSTGASMGAFIPSGSNGLAFATGITFGPDGNLYVASWGTDSVMRFNGTTGAFIDVYISAGSGTLSNSDYLNFIPEHQVTVASSNIDPTLDNAIADQSATERMPFSFTVDANAFSDADLDTLVYSAQLADSSPLPGWLNFDAASRTFSGTPLNANIGTLSVQVIADDGQGGTAASNTFDIVVAKSSTSTLWLSTQDTATDNNSDVINPNEIASFGNPDLVLELGDGSSGVTDGTFLTEYSLPENVRAMHYVNTDVTVDTYIGGAAGAGGTAGTRLLEAGQIVLSMRGASDFTVDAIGGGTITVNNTDILVYDPNEGTSGAFAFLIEDAILKPDNSTPANIHAVSIVEQTMTVGVNTTLTAGTYLIARSDPDVHADISTYTYATGLQDFLLGTDFLSSPADQVQGIQIISATSVNLGGVNLSQGMLLVSVETNQVVGTTALASVAATAQNIDVIALDIKSTQQDTVPLTNVDANILFDGSDIGLTVGGSLEINGLSIYVANNAPTGGVTISGSAIEDSVLTAADTLADEDGLGAITYQWLRDGVEIAGATSVNYTLGDPDVGSIVTVEARYTDGEGNLENVSSSPTAVVGGINDAPILTIPTAVFINEIHYDNGVPDLSEGIEIAGVAGTDLNGWSLVLYSGADTLAYHTEILSGIIPNQSNGFGTLAWVNAVGDLIKDAEVNPDGLALVDAAGNVVQFLSYEGTFTASDGPASGMLSVDIGVSESFVTPAASSLQLKGSGANFFWAPSSGDSFGSINAGQNFTAMAAATHQNMLEDGILVFNAANGNAISIADADDGQGAADPMSVQLTASNGVLTLGGTAGLGSVVGNGSDTITITGTVAEVNAALNNLSFAPAEHYNGPVSLSIVVDDQGNFGSGGALQTGGVIFIAVAPQDDAPVIGGVDVGAVTEDIDTDSDTLLEISDTLTIADPDAGESSFIAETISGTYGNLVIEADGDWSYSASNTQTAVQQLDVTESLTEALTVTTADGSTHNIVITINGSNDAPVLSVETGDSAAETLTETNAALSVSDTLTVTDVDLTDVVTSDVIGVVESGTTSGIANGTLLAMMSITGALNATETSGALAWAFNSGTETFDYLEAGQALTLTYTVEVDDGTAQDTQTIVITINGSNDAPVLSVETGDSVAATLTETNTTLSVSDTLTVTDIDLTDVVTSDVISVVEAGDTSGIANATLLAMMDITGDLDATETSEALAWTFNSGAENFDYLQAGRTLTLTYTVEVDDGTAKDTQTIVITINGSNDAPVLSIETGDSAAATLTESNATLSVSDTLTVTDIDLTDVVTSDVIGVVETGNTSGIANGTLLAMLNITGALDATETSEALAWTFNSGAQTFNYLEAGQTLTLTYTIEVDDGTAQDTQTIVITINGGNDAPVIGGVDTGAVTEDVDPDSDTLLEVSNTLTIADPDAGQSSFVAGTIVGTYGNLVIDAAGNWSYSADNTQVAIQHLQATESITETLTVTTADGTNHNVVITINGSNDAPVLSVETGDSVAETLTETNAALSVSDSVTVTDVDLTDLVSSSVLSVVESGNTSGIANATLLAMMNISGDLDATETSEALAWTFNSGAQAFNYLQAGQTLTLTYTVEVDDGTAQDTQAIVITINGSSDAPVIGGTDTGAVTEDVDPDADDLLEVNNRLTIADPDAGQSSFVAGTIVGTYGNLVIDATGNWSYSADNTQSAIQQLDASEFITDTLTVATADGSTHDIVITINGAEDAAVTGGSNTGTVAEDGTLSASATLTITDTDANDNPVSYSDQASSTGYGSFVMSSNTWTYTLDNTLAAVQELDAGETVTETFTVNATDGSTQTVTVTVNGADDAPTVDNAIPDQTATEDAAFSFTFNANSFADVDASDALVYTAQLSGGGTLPLWLDFDSDTRTFSGTPLNADVGTITVEVTADDGAGGASVTDNFDIAIANSNDAPEGSVVLSPASPGLGQTLSAAISVTDADGMGPLSYQWQRAGVDIDGATSSTYVVTSADTGAPLTLVVSYIDGFGQAETVASNNAAVFIPPIVEPTPPAPEPEPEPEPETPDGGTPTENEDASVPEPEILEPPVEPGFEAETDESDETVTVFDSINDEAARQINAAIDESAQSEVDEPLDYKEKEFSIAEVSFNLVRMQSEYTPYNDPLTLVQFGGFVDAIDQMREDIIEAALNNAPVVGSTFAVSAGMSAGYVAWLARSGAVLGSVMSAMPMWRFIDPLPVLNKLDADGEDEESLEAIIENSEKNSAAADAQARVSAEAGADGISSDPINNPGEQPDSTH